MKETRTMANRYLARDDAPFGDDVWGVLDAAMAETARAELAGRRLLHVDGPLGLGLKAISLGDKSTPDGFITSRMLPLALIHQQFLLSARDLASYEQDKIALDTSPVVEAARAVARMEDALVFDGIDGLPGLMTVDGAERLKLSAWDEVGAAANDVIKAITALDAAGFHGPYALALSPLRYNLLFRLYNRGNRSELEHLRKMVEDGVVKAPYLGSGGVLLASGRRFASIAVGQDMSIGLVGPVGPDLEFAVSESLALYVREPGAICALTE
jgi:uncharacterized linocin/CFP29 family protein